MKMHTEILRQLLPLSWDHMPSILYPFVYLYHKHSVARGRVRGVSSQICVRCCVTSCSVSCGLCMVCSGLCWAVFSSPQPPPTPRAVHSAPRIPQPCILPPLPGAVQRAPQNSTGLHIYIFREPCTCPDPFNLHHCSPLTVGNIHVAIFISLL